MKKLTLLTLLAVAVFSTAAMADTITLRISDGTTTTVVSSLTNIVTFSGSVGNFSIQFTAGTDNVPGTASFGQVNITNNNVTNHGNAAGILTFVLTGQGFSLPGPSATPLVLLSAGSYSESLGISGGSSVSFRGFADASNGFGLLNGTGVCTLSGPGTAGACPTGAPTFFTRGAGDYSLTEVTRLSLAAGDQINTTGSVSAVPEPASLALLGSGLLFGGGYMRRRLNVR